ncbi:MAG: phospholipase C [Polyangiales bacterium]
MRLLRVCSRISLPVLMCVSCSSAPAAVSPTDSGADTLLTSDASGGADVADETSGLVDNSPASWNQPISPPSDSDATTKRAACGYGPGDMPLATQGASAPDGSKIPIDTIVIMMMENRSFDHYFQNLPSAGQTDVDVAPATFTNPSTDGKTTVPISHDTQLCIVDPNHTWAGTHQQFNAGKMDGFVASNDGYGDLPAHGTSELMAGSRVMVNYDQTDLPLAYWAANTFSLADHYHSALLGPTWPNRMFLYAATSFGVTDNTFPTGYGNILIDNLNTRGVSWAIYTDGTPGMAVFTTKTIDNRANIFPVAQFATDAAAGLLPQVVFLDPKLGEEAFNQVDEHPPAIMQEGEAWIAQQVKALVNSPQWPRAALFWTYDEHGGFYDHQVPPPACTPDDVAVQSHPGDPAGAKFDTYGIRVPMMVLSPWVKKHTVAHGVYDHTSIVRFVESRFRLPAMTRRDANAAVPWEMFDFTQTPDNTPPTIPSVTVDAAKLAACKATYTP